MSLWSTYGTDPSKESEGVWIEIPDDSGVVVRFKLAYIGPNNVELQKELEKLVRPYRRQLKKGASIDPVVQRSLFIKAFVKTVLLDWENVTDQHGNIIPYSHDNGELVLTKLPVLFDILQEEAGYIGNFQSEAVEEEAKN